MLVRTVTLLVALLFGAAASRAGRAGLASLAHPAGADDHCRQRHGGGAGTARRPHRDRNSRPRRQRGRRRGRGRLCACGDLSARRQYRRRRLHGDPSRQDGRRCRDRLSRNRAGRRDRENVSRRRTASPIRKNRATLRSPIGVPGTVAGLALAHEKYGSGKFSLAELIEPAITLARNGVEIVDDIADTLPHGAAAHRALAIERAGFSQQRRHRARCRARICCSPISRSRCGPSPATGRKDFTKVRSRKRSSPPCARPAAS